MPEDNGLFEGKLVGKSGATPLVFADREWFDILETSFEEWEEFLKTPLYRDLKRIMEAAQQGHRLQNDEESDTRVMTLRQGLIMGLKEATGYPENIRDNLLAAQTREADKDER